ncbi:MAG: metal-dependent hydrolase [Chloroflexaceae bacterium]|nr:metal-dependent hydrolase [Chloroflexaceae bacterium]
MHPYQHALISLCAAGALGRCGYRVHIGALVFGGMVPDIDFLVLLPLMGRMAGHRTITHAPLFQIGLAWLLRRWGFWSVLLGQLLHSFTDSLGPGNPRGVAWLWPWRWQRVDMFQLLNLVRRTRE